VDERTLRRILRGRKDFWGDCIGLDLGRISQRREICAHVSH
jgi:hypothetical protein